MDIERRQFPKTSGLALLGAAIVALAAGSGYFLYATDISLALQTRPGPPAGANPSIVVKPFANLSGDPAQDYLADVLTD